MKTLLTGESPCSWVWGVGSEPRGALAHRRAKLTVFGRRLLVDRIEVEGWAWRTPRRRQASAARPRPSGCAATGRRARGPRGRQLAGRVARPAPCRPSGWRRSWPPATNSATAAPPGAMPGRTALDHRRRPAPPRPVAPGGSGPAAGIPIRYVRERPGELLHIDVKKLGRIPDGGGHRVRGPRNGTPRVAGRGYDYVHQAVDDMSRVAYGEVFPDERGTTCAGFLRDAGGLLRPPGRPHRAGDDRQRQELHRLAGLPGGARGDRCPPQAHPRPTGPRPTASRSASTGPCSRMGLRPRATTPTPSGSRRCPSSLTITTIDDPTARCGGLTPMAALVNNVSVNHS